MPGLRHSQLDCSELRSILFLEALNEADWVIQLVWLDINDWDGLKLRVAREFKRLAGFSS